MAHLGTIFNSMMANDPIPAVDELRARDQWVTWKLLTRPGASKPTKPPVNPHTGGPASHSDPRTWSSYARAEARAKRDSLAGVGFVLTDDDDYTGIDLDKCRDPATGEIEPWAQAILDLAETYAEVSPSGTGIRMIVRGKIEKAVKSDVAHVEIYVSQRYLTITEQHIEGTPNEIHEAPKTLAALIARAESMRPKREEPQPSPIPPRPSSAPRGNETRERAWASKALEGVTSELAGQGEGGRNHALNAAAYRLGRLVARGWIAQAEAIAALEEACRANGLWKDDGPKGVRATLMSGLRSGMAQPHEDLPESEYGSDPEAEALGDRIATKLLQMVDDTVIDAETGRHSSAVDPLPVIDLDDIAAKESTQTDGDAIPDYADLVLARPGLVTDIATWIMSTARVRRKRFALAGALAVVAVVSGRRYMTPTMAETNLYSLMVTKSGSGKEAAISGMKSLLTAAKLSSLIGYGGVKSDAALYISCFDRPVQLMPMDEFGDTLASYTGRNAAAHLQGIMPAMRMLWGGGQVTPPYAASRGDLNTNRPCLTILAASTPRQFFDAISERDAENGTINRFLMFYAADYVERSRVNYANSQTPPDIVSRLASLAQLDSLGCVQNHGKLEWGHVISSAIVQWTDEADDAWHAYERRVDFESRSCRKRESLGPRLALNAQKIATIIAIGEDTESPLVTIDHINLGIAVAEGSFHDMTCRWGSHVKSTEEGEFVEKVLGVIAAAPGGVLSERAIVKKLRSGARNARAITDALHTLLKSNEVRKVELKPKRGPGTTGYQITEGSL